MSSQKVGCGFFSQTPIQVGYTQRPGYKINYELFGQGSIKVVCVIGYMASMAGWDSIINYFLTLPNSQYQFLVFDNRGMGRSTSGPFALYTTASMARDVEAVLKSVGWTKERSVHLCGLSMGGMISQELAFLIPGRFKSLSLMVTCAKHSTKPEHRGRIERTYLRHILSTPRDRLKAMQEINFSDTEWLAAFDERYPEFKHNGERMLETFAHRIKNSPSSGIKTLVGQGWAVKSHNMTPDKLAVIAAEIPVIKVFTGELDKVIDPACSDYLAQHLGITAIHFPNKGHILTSESEHLTIEQLEENFRLGEEAFTLLD
jgi:pimeloyl-ACP methyl ester carboxylesterase